MRKKNSSVNKVKKKNINLHINSIYQVFETRIKRYVGKKDFSVGVSGGGDSLCLAFFSKIYQKKYGNKIYYFIVDHGLRKNSHEEAILVKKLLKKHNISSRILKWEGKVPDRNVQSIARDIRYSLIDKNCKKYGIKFLLTAHHLDDQIETFFMRLIRGSGLVGLSSMSEKNNYKKIKIIRPFLSIKKRDLIKITGHIFKKYIKDPTNKNQKYFRTRIRMLIKLMEKEGLNFSKIVKTISNLSDSKQSLEFYIKIAIKKYVRNKKKVYFINKDIFSNEPNEIIFRVISQVFLNIGERNYPPRSKKILNLIRNIKSKSFKKSTLSDCIITAKDNFIVFKLNAAKS